MAKKMISILLAACMSVVLCAPVGAVMLSKEELAGIRNWTQHVANLPDIYDVDFIDRREEIADAVAEYEGLPAICRSHIEATDELLDVLIRMRNLYDYAFAWYPLPNGIAYW